MDRRSRRKLGSRNYKNYTPEMLDLAVDLVKKKNISSLEAEKRFHIPRRTIENKVKGLHMKPPGGQLRLSETEEKDIVDVLIAAADFGSPLSRLDLRILIFEYLNKNRRTALFSGKIPGKWWVKHFLIRNCHALTVRAVQNIKKTRAEKTVEEFENYFINLERTLKDIPKENILNYDETNLSDNPGSVKCIFRRKVKYPERILNHSKGNISIMFAASADGSLLPIYTVYKSEHLWSAWCVGGPPEARFNRTKSGWFDSVVFEDWFRNVVIPWATQLDGPKLVIGDNLSSHLNVDITRLCEQHDIRFTFLPPNSTHITQPLDVAYFGPLKKVWRKILTEYKIKNPSEAQINKSHFPVLLKKLLDGIQTSNKENIKAGFRATGIVPFNPQKVLKKIPDFEEETKYKIDTALLDYLKKIKAPNPIKRTVRNKKLKVEPGSSISSQDAEKLLTKQKTLTKKPTELKTDQSNTSGKRVTILSDIRFAPENQAYVDIKQCTSLDLKEIDTKSKLTLKKKGAENINPWENPEPSTSGTQKVTKMKLLNRKQMPIKKQKLDYDSDEENDDNYSLRDTSDEEPIMSEDEDKALYTILKHNSKYETDYYVSEMPDIDNIGLYVDLETNENEGIDLHERQKNKLNMDRKTGTHENKEHNEMDLDEIDFHGSKETENFTNLDFQEPEIKGNQDANQLEKNRLTLDKTEKKEKTDNQTKNYVEELKTNDTGNTNKEILKEAVNSEEVESRKTDCEDENNKCTIKIVKQKMTDTDILDKGEVNLMKLSDNESMISRIDNIETKDKIDDNDTKNCAEEMKIYNTENINKEIIKKFFNSEHDESRNVNSDNECVISEKSGKKQHTFCEKESVLIRYYNRNKWKYYVGFIEKVDVQEVDTYYSIVFLKTVKKPNLKFILCKRDRDVVPSSSVVKNVKLHSVKENREFIIDDCDKHYF